jgi:hypothetical protein
METAGNFLKNLELLQKRIRNWQSVGTKADALFVFCRSLITSGVEKHPFRPFPYLIRLFSFD